MAKHATGDPVRVMVIDDSPTVNRITADALLAADYQPVITGSMEEAMAGDTIDTVAAVIVDIILPGMGGLEGIARLRASHPGLGIVAMSAGDASMDAGHLLQAARGAGADAILQKPFTAGNLEAAVRQALDAVAETGERKRRILVIDDSRTIRAAVEGMLPADRFKVQTAESFEQALAAHEIVGVDVVLTDIFMPGIGGIGAIRGIKANWPEVRVVAMSAGFAHEMDTSDALKAAGKAGADGVIAKPFDDTHLLLVLDALDDGRAAAP